MEITQNLIRLIRKIECKVDSTNYPYANDEVEIQEAMGIPKDKMIKYVMNSLDDKEYYANTIEIFVGEYKILTILRRKPRSEYVRSKNDEWDLLDIPNIEEVLNKIYETVEEISERYCKEREERRKKSEEYWKGVELANHSKAAVDLNDFCKMIWG